MSDQSPRTTTSTARSRSERTPSRALGISVASIIVMGAAGVATAFPPPGWDATVGGTDANGCAPSIEMVKGVGVSPCPSTGACANGSFAYPKPFSGLTIATGKERKEASRLSDDERATLKLVFKLLHDRTDTHPDDPRNMLNVSMLHCFYCAGQHPNVYDVHKNLWFLPYHRAMLFFTERIMRKLLVDDAALALSKANALPKANQTEITARDKAIAAANKKGTEAAAFAVPYWNWKDKQIHGMYLAGGGSTSLPDNAPMASTYGGPVKQMPSNSPNLASDWGTTIQQTADTFFGYTGGGAAGSTPHYIPHNEAGGWLWNVQHSSRQPLFYAHHANVDRMWTAWTTAQGSGAKRPSVGTAVGWPEDYWTTRTMQFPDEDGQWVQVTAHDMTGNLGYTYKTSYALSNGSTAVEP